MSHPLRADIFKVLTQHPASPADLTRELGLSRKQLPNVTYHVEKLIELGCAEVVEERQVDGRPPAKVVTATERSIIEAGEWDRLLEEEPDVAEHILFEVMQVQLDDYTKALAAGTVGQDEHFHMTRTTRVLDFPGFLELLELKEETRRAEDEIERRAAERRAEDGSDALHVSSSLSAFRLPPPADPA